MIDHIGYEVSDLARSAAFYDAVFRALGGRRMIDSEHAVAYGVNRPSLWIVVRGRPPAAGYGHVALGCTGGRHRSVAIAEHLAARYDSIKEYVVEVVHRDERRPQ
ncbi:MAG TPA: RNase adapter RapZ [Solirubrobacteraceae bacterium]|nr:RNase adapter RapZ [Solirubrobacteraceae bacterium]